jgi:hypothetical protein
MLRKIFARLREPSSLAGLSMLGLLFGGDPMKVDLTVQALGALLAAGAVLMPEKAK